MQEQLIYRTPSRAEIDVIMVEAYQLRSAAFARGFVMLGRAIAGGAGRVGTFLRQFAESVGKARAAREVYDELSRMSDRELADMGLTRSDIPAVAAGVFQQPQEAPVTQPIARPVVERVRPTGDVAEPEFRKAA